MLNVAFALPKHRGLRVLCLGAHSDDIEIGCGGTLLRLLAERDDVEVCWAVLGSSGERDVEAMEGAAHFLAGANKKDVIVEHFKTSYFPWVGDRIKDFFEGLKERTSPDLIFTHYRDDRHQDHRLISDLTWSTYRNHLILEYEVMKYDGDLGSPNLFVALDEATCRRKADLLIDVFKSQRDKDWFTPDAFLALARLRGIEAKAPDGYAEGFYCRKVVV